MYGLLFESLHKHTETTYGIKIWSQILLDVNGSQRIFQTNKIYKEDLYERLIQCLSRSLNLSSEVLYTENGKYFAKFLIDSGFQTVLKVMGKDFVDFLSNIDEIHKYLKRSYPSIHPPTFNVVEIESDHIIHLFYCTKRRKFVHFVKGQLISIAKLLFQLDIEVELVGEDYGNLLPSSFYTGMHFRIQCSNGKLQIKDDVSDIKSLCLSQNIFESSLSRNELQLLIPFHLIINQHLRIIKVGKAFQRMNNNLEGQKFCDFFSITYPIICCNFAQVIQVLHSFYSENQICYSQFVLYLSIEKTNQGVLNSCFILVWELLAVRPSDYKANSYTIQPLRLVSIAHEF
ncbi:unnamed protein product [Trichobilharzia regenti]|nr:unnamed protein product [Trichobilharzia regenti]